MHNLAMPCIEALAVVVESDLKMVETNWYQIQGAIATSYWVRSRDESVFAVILYLQLFQQLRNQTRILNFHPFLPYFIIPIIDSCWFRHSTSVWRMQVPTIPFNHETQDFYFTIVIACIYLCLSRSVYALKLHKVLSDFTEHVASLDVWNRHGTTPNPKISKCLRALDVISSKMCFAKVNGGNLSMSSGRPMRLHHLKDVIRESSLCYITCEFRDQKQKIERYT